MSTAKGKVRAYPFSSPEGITLDPAYAELREHEPVSRVRYPYGEESWLSLRYDDVKLVLSDPRFSRAVALDHDEPRPNAHPLPPNILTMDPPEHSRLRRLIGQAFTVRRVESLRPKVHEIVHGFVDEMIAQGPPVDLKEFAVALPLSVICELMGVPYEDRPDFEVWSEALVSANSLPPQTIYEYYGKFRGYLAGLIAQRRVEPTDDLLGAMVKARDADDRLTEAELVDLGIGLLAVGFETTATSIANFVYTLLTHPAQLRMLVDDPALVPTAVEELLRYVPNAASSVFARYATEDVELSGVTVRKGEPVLTSRAAANRDPAVFDDPENLDVTRTPNPHIGFGHGVHFCIGAALGRMELQVAIELLLRRLPDLALAVDEQDLVWSKGLFLRGLKALPVTWAAPGPVRNREAGLRRPS